jgi:hypothetical protein
MIIHEVVNIDYKNIPTTSAEPEASSMIETFRAIGYSLEAAIADIIDNSISADAKNVWLNYHWNGAQTIISIKDDGSGMNNDELIQAMRPGCRHPLEERQAKDLGRFGLGLKTASFSQTRKFSVISKGSPGEINYWAWDLDYVNQVKAWKLIKFLPDRSFISELESQLSGTIVLWYDLDRLLKNTDSEDKEALSKFMEVMEKVKNHLSMVFHRFMEQGKLNIFFQDRKIESWDPFLRGENGIQPMPEEFLQEGAVYIKGYVLPHKSRITEEVFKKAAGLKGWNEQQGFYIYRNERLLVYGDWLGLFKKEEHYKLSRILIDLPNSIDNEWQIDIKKSVARPPLKIRNQLRAYANDVRNQAVNVYRHKGRILQRKYPSFNFVPVWNEKQRHGKRFYSLNREHPIIKEFVDSDNGIGELLRFIEETVPVPLITIKESEDPESYGIPFEGADHEILRNRMKILFIAMIQQGKSKDETGAILLSLEPFDKYPEYIEFLKEEIC